MKPSEKDLRAQEVARAMIAAEGTAPAWGLVYEDGGVGWARVSFKVTADKLNGHGTLHGGMTCALADSALAYACNSRNQRTVVFQGSMTYLNPGVLGKTMIAEAREVALEGRTGIYEALITLSLIHI